ncbi:AMP-binding protein [Runella sp.]|uniref:AMP-binding protein n=1 Tax=Runella sp. TaxID=1960881 RepID=UPI003D11EA68
MYYEINPKTILQTPAPDDPYFRQAWEFCCEWAKGQTAFILHTSGSTGQPKPITLTRTQMQASARMTHRALELKEENTALVCLNTAYIAGTMMLVRGMEIGMIMYVVPPAAQPFAVLPEALKIDFAAFVPLQLQTILEQTTSQLETLKVILVGGAPVTGSLLTQIRQLNVPVFSTYGMTETVSHVALQRLNGTATINGSYELLAGIKTETDERGCLRICGAVTNNEWIQTNDVVEFTDERRFQIIGRADNIINSGGVKIQLEKVERAFGQVWKGSERYFAWWMPDERLGQRLILVLETSESVENEPLKKGLASLLNPYEIPKQVISIEKFSETPTGKVDKRATFARSQSS